MSKRSGLTITEVLVLIAVGGIIMASVAELFSFQTKLRMRAVPKDVLANLMTNNLIEINARPTEAAPGFDVCRVRLYDRSQNLSSETTPLITSQDCIDPIPTGSDVYKVIVRAKDPNVSGAIEINFSPQEFLKLPQFNPLVIKAIEIEGGFRGDPERNETPYKLFLTTFKR